MLKIVCYSLSGKSGTIAGKLAAILDTDCLQIQDIKDRRGLLGFLRSGFESATRRIPKIRPFDPPLTPADFSNYDGVLLVAPVWARSICSPLRAFLQEYGTGIKRYALILICSDPIRKYEAAWQEVQTLCSGENCFNATIYSDAADLEHQVATAGQALLTAFPE